MAQINDLKSRQTLSQSSVCHHEALPVSNIFSTWVKQLNGGQNHTNDVVVRTTPGPSQEKSLWNWIRGALRKAGVRLALEGYERNASIFNRAKLQCGGAIG